MSLSLKHIPCPAGKSCTAFQCIFGHAKDTGAEAAVVPQPSDNLERRSPSPTAEEVPRKRIKIDQYDSAPQPQREVTTDKANKNHGEELVPKTLPLTATKPVSPPPVRRNVEPAGSKASLGSALHGASPSTKAAKPPATGNGKPVTKATAHSTKARKPESLNPRLLKSSPASHETRLKLLKMLHAEFARLNCELKKDAEPEEASLVMSDQDLIFKALDDEQITALEKPAVYANVMKNKVMQYKKTKVAQWKEERIKQHPSSQNRVQANGGRKPIEVETGLSSQQEVALLKRLVTDITGLSNHGYVSSVPSEEAAATARSGLEAAKGWEVCDRCQQRFQVFPGRREEDGALTSGGSCNFHWGRAYVPAKPPGDTSRVPKRWQCCGQEVGDSAGCFTHDKHVFKASDPKRLAAVLNYAATPDNPNTPKDRAVCFDCEMGYTVHGMELIRLTATAWPTGEELLDILVQPIGEILDLNSRYSGVWPDDLANSAAWTASDLDPATAVVAENNNTSEKRVLKQNKLKKVSSPEVARDLLFSLLSPSTPLIGHGLENDLNAVRVVHPTLIDTVLLYPHKGGLPYRYGLKMLMDVHLNKKIQQETGPKVTGHDSAEDARAAGELVRLKVMNEWKDMQRAGWRLVHGEFWPPGKPEGKLTEAFIEET
ncbi:RNA exonuclease 3 [Conoideocrella luteorostrata]|uniref:RNA exonuclease 3 n=1 Tax=Conoideocrella luteorostrata TaxID=1105319 RepID=A0AAJ0CJL9_9HYPO|nr:RNA exonuclease 3 [Conoideocrella luteorostrata]